MYNSIGMCYLHDIVQMYVYLLFVCFLYETNISFATMIRDDVDIFSYTIVSPVPVQSGDRLLPFSHTSSSLVRFFYNQGIDLNEGRTYC